MNSCFAMSRFPSPCASCARMSFSRSVSAGLGERIRSSMRLATGGDSAVRPAAAPRMAA
ncbi:hypothetical protein ABH926_002807 [Catenulispora sp. GP43]